jgi:hypothetical protein
MNLSGHMIGARSCLGDCSMPLGTRASNTVLPLRQSGNERGAFEIWGTSGGGRQCCRSMHIVVQQYRCLTSTVQRVVRSVTACAAALFLLVFPQHRQRFLPPSAAEKQSQPLSNATNTPPARARSSASPPSLAPLRHSSFDFTLPCYGASTSHAAHPLLRRQLD